MMKREAKEQRANTDKNPLFKWLMHLLLLSAMTFFSCHCHAFDFAYDGDWHYQPILINGETVFAGAAQDSAARYVPLRPLLDAYKRPFTVLDLGANNGYFSLRIAHDYDATCIMVDVTHRLKEICSRNTSLDHILYLQKGMRAQDIEELASREHFDIVLCFHLLHHVDDWLRFVNALFKLGDHVIIETPPVNDGHLNAKPTIPEIAKYLTAHPGARCIGSFPRQTPEILDHMLLFSFPHTAEEIHRDFERCAWFDPVSKTWTPIVPGISLSTFIDFGGAYPFVDLPPDPKKWTISGKVPLRVLTSPVSELSPPNLSRK